MTPNDNHKATAQTMLEKWRQGKSVGFLRIEDGEYCHAYSAKALLELISLARDAALEEAGAKLKDILSEVKELLTLTPFHNGKPSRLWSGAERYLKIAIAEIRALRVDTQERGKKEDPTP